MAVIQVRSPYGFSEKVSPQTLLSDDHPEVLQHVLSWDFQVIMRLVLPPRGLKPILGHEDPCVKR